MKEAWQAKKLGEVAQVSAGNSAPQDKRLFANGTHPFFRTADAGRLRFGDIYEATDYLNDDGAKALRRYPKGTILFPKSGASTFLNHRVMLGVEGYVSSHLATIVADRAQVEPRYLLYFLSTISAQDLVQDHAYPSLNLPAISGIIIQAPPLPEQQRIVALLDEAFAGLATAKATAERNLQNARAIFESHLQSVFSERGDEWVEKPLGEVCIVKDGTHDSPKYVAEGIPFVTQKNIREDGLSFEKTKFISQPDHDDFYRRSNAAYGDILISMIGANRGMACIVNDERTFSIKNVGLVKQNPSINQEFLLYFLKSPQAANFVRRASKGGAQEFIGLTELRRFPCPLLPLEHQKELAKTFLSLREETQRLTRLYERKLTALEELKKSLLHQAFNGEL